MNFGMNRVFGLPTRLQPYGSIFWAKEDFVLIEIVGLGVVHDLLEGVFQMIGSL